MNQEIIQRARFRRAPESVVSGLALCFSSLSFSGGCLEAPPFPDLSTHSLERTSITVPDGTPVAVDIWHPTVSETPRCTIIGAHGFAGDKESLYDFMPIGPYRYVFFTAPGFDDSDPFLTGTHSVQRVGEEVIGALVDTFQDSPTVLFGYSMGGMECISYLASQPDRSVMSVIVNSQDTPLRSSAINALQQLFFPKGEETPFSNAQQFLWSWNEYVNSMEQFDLSCYVDGNCSSQPLFLDLPTQIIYSTDDNLLLGAESFADRATAGGDVEAVGVSGGHEPDLFQLQRIREQFKQFLEARLP